MYLPQACDGLLSLWKTVYTVTCVLLGGVLPYWQLDKVGENCSGKRGELIETHIVCGPDGSLCSLRFEIFALDV
jgi:hypothetical protein